MDSLTAGKCESRFVYLLLHSTAVPAIVPGGVATFKATLLTQ